MKKILILFFAVLIISLINAQPPLTVIFTGDEGLSVQATTLPYIKVGTPFDIMVHVFNETTGYLLFSPAVSCTAHLQDLNGSFLDKQQAEAHEEYFKVSYDETNITIRGLYGYSIHCNSSNVGGSLTSYFEANGYGAELSEGTAITFNFAMIFMMILFVLSLIGIFVFENPTGKLACYWISHLFFVIGTFSVWQFNYGYGVSYLGLAGIYKILFYVSIIAVFPMVLLSLAWIFYIHTMNDDIKKLMDRGMDEDEAVSRAKSNRRNKNG